MKVLLGFFSLIGALSGEAHSSSLLMDSPFNEHTIEFTYQKPLDPKPQLILFLHGSDGEGCTEIGSHHYSYWLEKGFSVGAISLPGYGRSTGTKDFCGPVTIESLDYALDRIKQETGALKVGIIGFGQGGLAAILLSCERDDLSGIICSNGGYDLLRHKKVGDLLMKRIEEKGYDLDLSDEKALSLRSPYSQVESITAPLFLLHRAGHPQITEEEVLDFKLALIQAGGDCQLLFKEKGVLDHWEKIGYPDLLELGSSWLEERME